MKTNRREPDGKGRLVYSTNLGRVCPGCGWPTLDCKCSQQAGDEPIPDRIVAKLRLEKKGRGGKTVTVVAGLPQNGAFLKDLCQDGGVELQGDLRDRVRESLLKKGFTVKG